MFGVKKFDSNQIRNHIRKFRINYKILIYNTIPQLSPPSLLQQRGGPGGVSTCDPKRGKDFV
jgi:hypothetical protein